MDDVRKFLLEALGVIFLDARQQAFAGKKPQPGVEQISLLDRFDYRRAGAFKIHG
jgi:hypothetical protein